MGKYQNRLSILRQSFVTIENGQPLVLDTYFKDTFDELEKACKFADTLHKNLKPIKRNCHKCSKYKKSSEYKALEKIKEELGSDPAYYDLDKEFQSLENLIKIKTCERCRMRYIKIGD